jgi:hypothetical protein
MPSFTTKVSDLQLTGAVVPIKLAVGSTDEDALRRAGQSIPTPVLVSAMIDIGASISVIREDLAKQLNLTTIGATLINTPSSAGFQCYEYFAKLIFPNNVTIESVVIAAPLQGQHIQCLIGRDVLRHGLLIYIGYDNSFTLSF